MGDARFGWFADTMDLRPSDQVLEIGPGSSPSPGLLAERVPEGKVIGVDRSATAVTRAAARLAPQLEAGRIGLLHADLDSSLPARLRAEFGIDRFDKILAVNVNVFWTKRPVTELATLAALLTPAGTLHLCYGYGDPTDPATSPKPPPGKLEAHLTTAGFLPRLRQSGDLLCVSATRA
ncbi:methyltransferase domain-containing protein [Nocardia puris]|uniref:Methyltransferase family protein n=1 Tax=Nocardia puris TaxID=208602 RepID=A0A366DAG5_9NOCA|nr:methyltransferase domain-containing protein [Nocardia puris]MBF6211758.1 methyltransferase domain-containing protein [Nocardia puris]MBF6365761.1 methyltransferase domain-containing protein [Nocardia puris]MBF6460596.1 methyltransferase domain-containing protein [Nocardia puris]RBO86935.1 methyltransferase family protein [Nocardia puris]